MANKMDVRSNLAEIFLKSIEEQPLSWNKNFRSAKRPVNGIYKNKYKGYNRMLLSYVMNQKGYQDPRFYPQSYIFGSPENKGKEWDDPTKIKVIKGEHPVFIDTGFFVPKNKRIKEEHDLKPISIPEYRKLSDEEQEWYRPVQKSIPVYNAQQLVGVEPWKEKERDVEMSQTFREELLQLIDRGAENMGVKVREGDYDTPCYIPDLDEILMPRKALFFDEYSYGAVKLHEMAHASGAKHRLNRDLSGGFGTEKYAIEELRAEIASCFMANEFGFEMPEILLDNHKAYVQSWADAIEKNKDVLISAIFDAEKISDYIEEKAELKKYKDQESLYRRKGDNTENEKPHDKETMEMFDCKWEVHRFTCEDAPDDLYNLNRISLTCIESNNPAYQVGSRQEFADFQNENINPGFKSQSEIRPVFRPDKMSFKKTESVIQNRDKELSFEK